MTDLRNATVANAIAVAKNLIRARRELLETRIAEADAAIETLDRQRYDHFINRQRDAAELADLNNASKGIA